MTLQSKVNVINISYQAVYDTVADSYDGIIIEWAH